MRFGVCGSVMHGTGRVLTSDLLAGESLLSKAPGLWALGQDREENGDPCRAACVDSGLERGAQGGSLVSFGGGGQFIHQHLPVLSVSQGSSGG